MYLIEGSESWIIEDLDNERSYILSDGKQVMTAKWPTTAEQERPYFIAIATGEEAALRVWNHLRSMLASKAPQPAPVETPRTVERKFRLGDTVAVTKAIAPSDNAYVGMQGVIYERIGDEDAGFYVRFNDEDTAMFHVTQLRIVAD